ncbi:MAG: cation:proton antiporter domain-containing protein [Limisphaerales bacterium]
MLAETGTPLVTEIALCIMAAWLLAVGFNALKQPVLLAYLVAGYALGPHGFGWVHNEPAIETVASIGLMLLLFMIGLEMDLRRMLSAGRVITLVGLAQIVGSTALALAFFGVAGLGTTWLEHVYLAVAVALSSTVIIVKLLHDKRELETGSGQITLGILVLQDLAAILFLALQPNLREPSVALILQSLGRVIVLLSAAFLASRYLLPALFRSIARLPELVLVGALAWCFAMAGLAHVLGLSREMGALVAGVALSTFPYAMDVGAKVTGIRDFFVTLFFVTLGLTFGRPGWNELKWALIIFVLIGVTRMLTVFVPLYLGRQGHRGALLPAINLSQMSELSIVLLTIGAKSGDLPESVLPALGFAFALSAVGSTYAIQQSDRLVRLFSGGLRRLGLRDLDAAPLEQASARTPRLFLLGFSWTASSLLEKLRRERPTLLDQIRVIDFNPTVYQQLRALGVSVVYGDISQSEVLSHAGIAQARVVVCSLSNTVLKGTDNLTLLRRVRQLNPNAQIIVNSETVAGVTPLYRHGAGFVTVPRLLEAIEIFDAIEAAEKNLLGDKRAGQEAALQDRSEVLP